MVMGLLDIVLIVILLVAYSRCRRGAFLLLSAGTLAFVYMNFFAAIVSVFALTKLRVFGVPPCAF
jgi:hypothetical protein